MAPWPAVALRVFLPLLAIATTACPDWQSLYVQPATDDAAAAADLDGGAADAAIKEPDSDAAVTADTAVASEGPPSSDAPACPPSSAPVVEWRFPEAAQPSADTFVPDSACAPPDIPLGWDLERKAGNTRTSDGVLYLDGGFLFASIPRSGDLGRLIAKTRGFTVELWLRGLRVQAATIVGTNSAPGRAFAVFQRDATIRFAVRTTATDAMGLRFSGPAGDTAEVTVPFPVQTTDPVHVLAGYAADTKLATVYINGVLAGRVSHVRPGVADPVPVWNAQNELGLGGGFDGTAWHGWLYRAAIYDRGLSADEARTLYQLGPGR